MRARTTTRRRTLFVLTAVAVIAASCNAADDGVLRDPESIEVSATDLGDPPTEIGDPPTDLGFSSAADSGGGDEVVAVTQRGRATKSRDKNSNDKKSDDTGNNGRGRGRNTTPTPAATATPAPTATPGIGPLPLPTPTATPRPNPTAIPTAGPTATVRPTVTPGPVATQPQAPVRAAFFYPWFPHAWNQGGVDPFTNYDPTLGRYESDDPTTIREQLDLAADAHIDAFISSWWGQGHHTDDALPALLDTTVGAGSPHPGLRWAIYYEEEGQGDPSSSVIADDLRYLRDEYFGHPGYLQVDGKPVVFVWADSGDGAGMANRWAAAVDSLGSDVYVVLKVFSGYRNVTNQPDSWHQYGPATASDDQLPYSYTVSPGFWLKGESVRLARSPQRFAADVAAMNASDAFWQLITTWNEWGEGTSVEPADEFGSTYLDILAANPPDKPGSPAPPPAPTSTPTPTSPPAPTPPPTGNGFTFTAGGDFGSTSATTAGFQEIAAIDPRFHLALGDLSYEDTTTEQAWCNYVTGHLGDIPVQIVVGNHEDDDRTDGVHINEFAACLPDRMNSTGTYAAEYYFDVDGLMRIIMLGAGNDVNGEDYDYSSGTSHYQWLEAAIDDARADGIRWIVVGIHKVCITSGNKPCELSLDLMDLLIDKRVDLMLHGHEHDYQRSKQVTCVAEENYLPGCIADSGADDSYVKGAGPVWVINGAFGGGGLTDIDNDDPEFGYLAEWMGANHAQPGRGFTKVSVTDTTLTVDFVGTTTSYSDHFVING